MSKKIIVVLAGIGVLFNFFFFVPDPTFRSFAFLGALAGFIAWIGAIRNAWYCKAYGWLVVVILTYSYGALFYGLFGPGRLAIPAEQLLRQLQAADTQPSKYTVPGIIQHLQQAGYVAEESTVRYTLRRFNWPVPG